MLTPVRGPAMRRDREFRGRSAAIGFSPSPFGRELAEVLREDPLPSVGQTGDASAGNQGHQCIEVAKLAHAASPYEELDERPGNDIGPTLEKSAGRPEAARRCQPIERNFTAEAPDRPWVADITYIPTWAGFLHLAVVLDAFSRRVVGRSMANHSRTRLVLDTLDMAFWQRRPDGVIHHSDQGSQYTSIAKVSRRPGNRGNSRKRRGGLSGS